MQMSHAEPLVIELEAELYSIDSLRSFTAPGRRARSKSVLAPCSMLVSIELIDLPFSHLLHGVVKHVSPIQPTFVSVYHGCAYSVTAG